MRTFISQKGVKLCFQRKGNLQSSSSRQGLTQRGSQKLGVTYLLLSDLTGGISVRITNMVVSHINDRAIVLSSFPGDLSTEKG